MRVIIRARQRSYRIERGASLHRDRRPSVAKTSCLKSAPSTWRDVMTNRNLADDTPARSTTLDAKRERERTAYRANCPRRRTFCKSVRRKKHILIISAFPSFSLAHEFRTFPWLVENRSCQSSLTRPTLLGVHAIFNFPRRHNFGRSNLSEFKQISFCHTRHTRVYHFDASRSSRISNRE